MFSIEGFIEFADTIDRFRTNIEASLVPNVIQRTLDTAEAVAHELVPVRTGNLRDSIHQEIGDTDGSLIASAGYAGFVELGTSKMQAEPFIQPGMEEATRAIPDIILEELQNALS